jgi:hypothetical protein
MFIDPIGFRRPEVLARDEGAVRGKETSIFVRNVLVEP